MIIGRKADHFLGKRKRRTPIKTNTRVFANHLQRGDAGAIRPSDPGGTGQPQPTSAEKQSVKKDNSK
jgi:hypothetical protein